MISDNPDASTNVGTEVDAGVNIAKVDPTPGPVSDEQLVRHVATGDVSALGKLYDRYMRQCFDLAEKILGGDASRAEEAAHLAFLELWARPNRYSAPEGGFLSWLLRVTHAKCLDQQRLHLLNHADVTYVSRLA